MSEAPSDSAAQPVVYVLVGDCNLSLALGEEATQPLQPEHADWKSVWQVHATTAARGGDLISVKGAVGHDLWIPGASQPREEQHVEAVPVV